MHVLCIPLIENTEYNIIPVWKENAYIEKCCMDGDDGDWSERLSDWDFMILLRAKCINYCSEWGCDLATWFHFHLYAIHSHHQSIQFNLIINKTTHAHTIQKKNSQNEKKCEYLKMRCHYFQLYRFCFQPTLNAVIQQEISVKVQSFPF